MKFLWNFFFFGILFYLIWVFFPDAFHTLVNWANHIVAFFKDLILGLSDKVQNQLPPNQLPSTAKEAPAFLAFFFARR